MFDFKYSYNKHILPVLLNLKYGRRFDRVETFGLFIGYPRSGHSLVGALLDAHPQMVFSQDLNIVGLMERPNFGKIQILGSILERSEEFAAAGATGLGHEQGSARYDFKVPNQFQGRQQGELIVVGDKQSAVTTSAFSRNPRLIEQLQRTTGLRLRYVHMIRNPYANISGIYRVKHGRGIISSLQDAIDYYFDQCGGVMKIKSVATEDILDVRLEDLIADPKTTLEQLCAHFNVPCSDAYVRDCSTVLFERPKEAASDVPWTLENIREVGRRLQEYEYLDGYQIPDKLKVQVGLDS